MQNQQVKDIVLKLAERLIAKKRCLVTAESCTGGLISSQLTAIAGSSEWFDRAYITYSNEAKQQMLGVKAQTLDSHGAVSEETVCEMAEGALLDDKPSLSVAVSGVAGPSGGSKEKPVGTVWIGWCLSGSAASTQCFHFDGDRDAVREQTVIAALEGLLARIQ